MLSRRGLSARPMSAREPPVEPLKSQLKGNQPRITASRSKPPAYKRTNSSLMAQEDHNEDDGPLRNDKRMSRISRAKLTMAQVMSTGTSPLEDTLRQQTLDSLESARRPATVLATEEFDRVRAECEKLVTFIAKDCAQRNRRFRDEHFDIANDAYNCLHGLLEPAEQYDPESVSRVTEVFKKPSLFVDGVNADDIKQGAIGDCWFVSALSVVSHLPDLLERLCVKCDEKIGVYGFVFFRDGHWFSTIIDDQLFIGQKQYDQLESYEKSSWQNDRKLYEETKLRGSRALYFASSSDTNETWVPLYEKAYAKAHGDYESMSGGYTGEAIEDLTGGVSTLINVKDILDEEVFWKEELMNANVDRLFSCYIMLDNAGDLTGLIAYHAYSILEAKVVNGMRFVVIRNPWGEHGEWNGAWSDGSKEWTPETMKAIGHRFGDDGKFIMEYSDFLKVWQIVDRCRIFDASWILSNYHVAVKVRPWPAAPSFGDVSFTVKITKKTDAVFVLSQQDSRYWYGLDGYLYWSLEFRVYRKGENEYISRSERGEFGQRAVNVEFKQLEPGEYIVHVRLDRSAFRDKDYLDTATPIVSKLSQVWGRLMQSRTLAGNYDVQADRNAKMAYLSPPSRVYAGRMLSEIPELGKGKGILGGGKKGDAVAVVAKEVNALSGVKEVAKEENAGKEEDKKGAEEKKDEKKEEDKKDEKKDEEKKDEKKGEEKKEEEKKEEKKPDDQAVADGKKGDKEDKKEDKEDKKEDKEEKKDDKKEDKTDDKKDDKDNKTADGPSSDGKPADDKKPEEKKPDPAPADEKAAATAGDKAPDAKADDDKDKDKTEEEKERENADMVFLLLRVYSSDKESKITAETRL